MATYTKYALSGSGSTTNGKSVSVSGSASPGAVIHNGVAGTSDWDEVWIYAQNSSTALVKLTIEYGGTSVTDTIEVSIPGENGLVLVIPGLVIQNGLTIRAFASVPGVINIFGFVNRITA